MTSWLHFYRKVRADQTKEGVGGRLKTEWEGGQRKEGLGSVDELTFKCIDHISRYVPAGQEACLWAQDGN